MGKIASLVPDKSASSFLVTLLVAATLSPVSLHSLLRIKLEIRRDF